MLPSDQILRKQSLDRRSHVGNWNRTVSIVQVFRVVDADRGANRGEEVGNADGIRNDVLRKLIGLAIGA